MNEDGTPKVLYHQTAADFLDVQHRKPGSGKERQRNAVLLDTEVSKPDSKGKSPNTAFMHKSYAPIVYNGNQYIAKVAVEEFYNEGKKAVDRRAYHLQGIKIEPAGGRLTANTDPTPVPVTDSTISISDLFNLVKTYDKGFSPKPVNPAFLNADGTPKVISHGTPKKGLKVFLCHSKNFSKTQRNLHKKKNF